MKNKKGSAGIVFLAIAIILLICAVFYLVSVGKISLPFVSVGIDLREQFQPYINMAPNSESLCVAAGGDWHWDKDFIGCTNLGGYDDCDTVAAQLAATLCHSAKARWQCDANDIYCKYD